MNSFLDLHTDANYINTNRKYYTDTWERTLISSDTLIPFQMNEISSDIAIYKVDLQGAETDITDHFSGGNKITSWTKTGTGPISTSGARILLWEADPGDYIVSNLFSLTSGETLTLFFYISEYTITGQDYEINLKNNGVSVWSDLMTNLTNSTEVPIVTTSSNYTLTVTHDSGTGGEDTGDNTPYISASTLINDNGYTWYNGKQLSDTLSGIFSLKIVGLSTYYSDYLEVCDVSEMMKYKISSSFDFGGIKYSNGYAQWIYKRANVRRSPRAEIEVVGDQRNGKIINEKVTSAVRYIIRMKVTESEFEALVHSMGCDIEITDSTGKIYNAANVEISDPTWYRSNGIAEVSFINEDNINVWTQNNSTI